MTWIDIGLLALFVGIVFGLVRAAKDLGGNPFQRDRMNKDLGVHFSQDTPLAEREARSNLWGISPSNGNRPIVIAILVAVFFVVYAYFKN